MLAPLVRAAGEEWDVGIARSAAFGAALLCGAVAAFLIWRPQPLPRWTGIALVLIVEVGAVILLSAALAAKSALQPARHAHQSTAFQNRGDRTRAGKRNPGQARTQPRAQLHCPPARMALARFDHHRLDRGVGR